MVELVAQQLHEHGRAQLQVVLGGRQREYVQERVELLLVEVVKLLDDLEALLLHRLVDVVREDENVVEHVRLVEHLALLVVQELVHVDYDLLVSDLLEYHLVVRHLLDYPDESVLVV